MAVKDHEHFRLKLVYKRKKKIQSNLREMEVKAQIFQVMIHWLSSSLDELCRILLKKSIIHCDVLDILGICWIISIWYKSLIILFQSRKWAFKV